MKQRTETIAEIYEKKNSRGHVYFSGQFEGGGKVRIVKTNKRNQYGEIVWEMQLIK